MANITINLSFLEHARLCALLNAGWESYWFANEEEAKLFEEALLKFSSAKTEKRKEQQ